VPFREVAFSVALRKISSTSVSFARVRMLEAV
jgi:hypothetical protein